MMGPGRDVDTVTDRPVLTSLAVRDTIPAARPL
jgi:hypothetical protein